MCFEIDKSCERSGFCDSLTVSRTDRDTQMMEAVSKMIVKCTMQAQL